MTWQEICEDKSKDGECKGLAVIENKWKLERKWIELICCDWKKNEEKEAMVKACTGYLYV